MLREVNSNLKNTLPKPWLFASKICEYGEFWFPSPTETSDDVSEYFSSSDFDPCWSTELLNSEREYKK